MRLLTVFSLFLFVLRTTRAMPLPVNELSSERALLGRYSPAGLIGREIHNADYNNAGGPPQSVNSGSGSQDPNAASQPQHSSPGTQAKPGSPEQDHQNQPNSPPNVKAARSESQGKISKFYARKHHTIKSGDRRHSVKARSLAADRQGVVSKHGHGNHATNSHHHHSETISSRKVTHQDPDSGDEKQLTPPPPTASFSNISESLPMMTGIEAPSLPGRYENSGTSSNGINNDGDERSIHGAGRLSKGIKVNRAVADNGASNSPLFGAALDPQQAV